MEQGGTAKQDLRESTGAAIPAGFPAAALQSSINARQDEAIGRSREEGDGESRRCGLALNLWRTEGNDERTR